MAPVGLVGLGLLGSAVAGRLRAAGHEVVGHDVVVERNRALEAIGGRAVTSAAAVAEAADPVCVVLPSLTAVEEIVLGARGLVAAAGGRTIVQMSTISPALTERLARECATRGVAFLDSGIVELNIIVAFKENYLEIHRAGLTVKTVRRARLLPLDNKNPITRAAQCAK